MGSDLNFDLFIARMKAQSQKKVFHDLASEAAVTCGVDAETLSRIFSRRLEERTFGMGRGVAIFDVKSLQVQHPVLVMATLENMVDFNALDGQPVNILAAVISPASLGPVHLQKLAQVSRLLNDEDLCNALRDARDEDAMRVLFLSSQGRMMAA